MAVLTIASNTYKKMFRLKALYLLLFTCILLMSCSYLYKLLTMDQEQSLLFNGGLAIIFTITTLLALIVGSSEVAKEIRLKTLDTLLSKPVGKAQFITGKFLGTALTALISMGIMSLGFVLLLAGYPENINSHLFQALILIAVEALVVSAISILFAVILGDPLGLIFAFLLVIIGHMAYFIPDILRFSQSFISKLFWVIYYLIPNFNILNARNEPMSWKMLVFCVIYGICYAGVAVTIAKLVFANKDIS